MSIICSICHDSLSEGPQSSSERNDLIVLALRCGHLFHEYCIQQWFNTGGANPASYVECPCCKKSSSLKNALRVYPTCEEESQERTRSRVSNQGLTNVVQELEDAREVLQQISSNLESETSSHESLQLEHGRLQSELQELKEQMQENKQVWEGIEASLKSKVKKLEKEKEERDRRLHRQLELLKEMHEESQAMLAGYDSSGGGGYEDQGNCVFVSGLPVTTKESDIAEYFGSIGILKIDKRTGKPKIWMHKDKVSGKSKGVCTVTYDDPDAARSAITWFNGKDFLGRILNVSMATRGVSSYGGGDGAGGGGSRSSGGGSDGGSSSSGGRGGRGGFRSGRGGGGDRGGSFGRRGGRGGGKYGGPPKRAFNPIAEGDWPCSDADCGNTNFSWMTECNCCGIPRLESSGSGDFAGGSVDRVGPPRGLSGFGDFGDRGGRRGCIEGFRLL